MELVLIGLGLLLIQTPTLAAPPVEACPPDSVLSADACKCDAALCAKPPCPTQLRQATNGSDLPGRCCPTYECVGCGKEEELDGKCPCAPQAVIEGGACLCVDKEKRLEDGQCVCNPLQCPLPPICDKKSVAVTVTGECCNKVICKPCPFDSESTNLETDELEDHCVCLPCKTDCGNNRTAVIKKHGSGFPGSCCDLYECKKPENAQGCFIGDAFYENGKEWKTADLQICKCNNGMTLCSKTRDKEAQSCFVDNKLYKDGEKWTKEDGCTECSCKAGLEQCISHFCDVKETHIAKNLSCFRQGRIYRPAETWLEKDGCTKCTCDDGVERCVGEPCDQTTTVKSNQCQPLANCNTTCLHGYKINRKGCEICKCNNARLSHDLLLKYNISLADLIKILEEFKRERTSTAAPAGGDVMATRAGGDVTAAPAGGDVNAAPAGGDVTAAPAGGDVEAAPAGGDVEAAPAGGDVEAAPAGGDVTAVVEDRFGERSELSVGDGRSTTTTTEPSMVPTDDSKESWVYIAIAVLAFGIFIIAISIMCIYKSRRKNSLNLTHCHYQTVNNLNNNMIKKTDQLV